MIRIERTPFSTVQYFAGEYTIYDKTYSFTLMVDTSAPLSISWGTVPPEGNENIERDIIRVFEGEKIS